MIRWMLFAAAVAALAGLAGLAAERGLRLARLPTRWAWVGAIAASLLLPLPFARREDAGHTRVIPISTLVPAVRAIPVIGGAPPVSTPAVRPSSAMLERALPVAWGVASVGLAAALAAGAWTLRRRKRRWERAVVAGAPVLLSDETGPAVVGVLAPQIVLPRWTLSLPEPLRRLIVRHEREHVDAADPWLALFGAAGVLLMPWSPALWWQLRRLRLAVEVDCDARVLRGGADARVYGAALLEVGCRLGRSRLAVAAFSEPASSLERRIHLMTAPRVRLALLRAAAFGAVSAVLLAVACEAPGPLQPSPGGSRRLYAAEGEAAGLPRAKISLREAVARYFPEVAQGGLGDDEYLTFTVSPGGDVVSHERLRRAPTPGEAAAVPGHKIAVKGREEQMVLARLPDDASVRSIDRMAQPAGAVAPTPVTIVWVQLKRPGEAPGEFQMSSSNADGRPDGLPRQISGFTDADGISAFASSDVPTTAPIPGREQLRAAIDRFYTPAMKAAAVRGRVDVRYTVGAAGRARIVAVNSETPALVPVGRAVVESLAFTGGPVATEARVGLMFGPRRTVGGGARLRRPTGPKR
ncbi:MAG TPA: M56 family metallopeptidase [Longimicrobium sp.]|nr:M56 family metallopeptidase [Longimicrobium sp.]